MWILTALQLPFKMCKSSVFPVLTLFGFGVPSNILPSCHRVTGPSGSLVYKLGVPLLRACTRHRAQSTLPSILHWAPGLQGLAQFVVSHWDPAEAISERSTPDPEALVPALH